MNEQLDNLLIDDHSQLGDLLEEIFTALQNGDPPVAFSRLDKFWARLAMHIRAEHLHLFPALLKTVLPQSAADENTTASARSVESMIDQLRADHNFFMSELAEAVKAMREIPRDYNGNSLTDLKAVKERLKNLARRLVAHNDIEESQIYPLAELLLAPDEAAAIRGKMKRELENIPPRFVDDPESGGDNATDR